MKRKYKGYTIIGNHSSYRKGYKIKEIGITFYQLKQAKEYIDKKQEANLK